MKAAFKWKLLLYLAASRIVVSVLPFKTLLNLLRRPVRKGHATQNVSEQAIAACALSLGKRFPVLAHCLAQAIAVKWLLGEHGFESRLKIGVNKNETKAFEAHAWVESGGVILVGGAERGYTPIFEC